MKIYSLEGEPGIYAGFIWREREKKKEKKNIQS
jgi:hypothetical protein